VSANSAQYRRYAQVARQLAKQPLGAHGFMWAQLATLWDKAADRMAAKEGQPPRLPSDRGEVQQP
jgi:hypothetical protein